MFDDLRLFWKLWGFWATLKAAFKEGTMNYWALANLVASGLAAAFVAIMAMHTADPNATMGGYLAAAGSALIAAVIQHLRGQPNLTGPPTA